MVSVEISGGFITTKAQKHQDRLKKQLSADFAEGRRFKNSNRRNLRNLRISFVFLGVFVPWW
jgi:hypothetical protein